MNHTALETQQRAVRQVAGRLSHARRDKRLLHLQQIVDSNELAINDVVGGGEVNNHVHTTFSFSPYSPTCAAFMARYARLQAVGSVDHDSIGAANEMSAAGRILGIGTTVGYELRVHFSGTALEGRKLNNPDSANIGYIVIHGVPQPAVDAVADFLKPIQRARNERNRRQVALLNQLLQPAGIESIDFDSEVLAISQAASGGTVTERHILFALAQRILGQAATQRAVAGYLRETFAIDVPDRLSSLIDDSANPHRSYDLLGILKSALLPQFFVQPDHQECIGVAGAVEFARSIGAIPCYAYLGDVGESPTGDKKAEKFEDEFLDVLFPEIRRVGFLGVTYMPPRNSREQLLRIRQLCRQYGFMEISGVDINSSRQLFRCPEIMQPEFQHLIDNTWALIAHEKLASAEAGYGLFDPCNPWAGESLQQRLSRYSRFGTQMDCTQPDTIIDIAGKER